jgi:hypothetical protein
MNAKNKMNFFAFFIIRVVGVFGIRASSRSRSARTTEITMHFKLVYAVHSTTNALFINLVKSFKFCNSINYISDISNYTLADRTNLYMKYKHKRTKHILV